MAKVHYERLEYSYYFELRKCHVKYFPIILLLYPFFAIVQSNLWLHKTMKNKWLSSM